MLDKINSESGVDTASEKANDVIIPENYLSEDELKNLTPAQINAICARGSSILVSAAAGSGKTFTLTKRIIRSIINDENRSLSRMLIVTFTRSAAADLKKKISEALSEAIAANPDNMHLQNELLNLGSAHISTIDSFFSAPVRANFEKLGLPASMRNADSAELMPIRESVMRTTLGEFFNTRSGIEKNKLADVGHRTAYTDLLALLQSDPRDTSKIIPTLLNYYNKTQTVPDGVSVIAESAERLLCGSKDDFFKTLEGEALKNSAISTTDTAIEGLKILIEQVTLKASEEANSAKLSGEEMPPHIKAIFDDVIPCLEKNRAECLALREKLNGDYETAYTAVHALTFQGFPILRGKKRSDLSVNTNKENNALIQGIKDLKTKSFCYTHDNVKEQLIQTAEASLLIYDILSDFDVRYNREKISRGICEFADMPKFVLRLLKENGNLTPLALAMRAQYDEVYVDEYQDVNAIQDEIFKIIGGDHRFMVGDIKQSIYCFRDAEPDLFKSYKESFPEYSKNTADTKNDTGDSTDRGCSIFMSENFRCDEGIINFSNEVCDKVFSSFSDSIGYDPQKDKLIFGKKKNVFSPPKRVQINIIEPEELTDTSDSDEENKPKISKQKKKPKEDSDQKFCDEATVTANEIARLIRDKNEKNADGSKLRAGNIAILVRKHEMIPPIADALSRVGIKYVTNANNELLGSDEVKLIVDLLTVIDNPRDDVPLSRILTASLPSYLPPFTLDEIIQIRECGKNHSLYDAIDSFGNEFGNDLECRCFRFVEAITKLRKISIRVSAEKLLRAVAASDYFSALCESEGFTYLYSVAGNYSKNSWNGLYSFVSYFKNLMKKDDRNSDPVKAGADEVTIITMHQSKGLEYNVCFLFGLGMGFNKSSIYRSIIFFDRERGISLKLPAPNDDDESILERTRIKSLDNILHSMSKSTALEKLAEEEARLFYVALTRARERLYLSATISKPYEELKSKLIGSGALLCQEFKSADCYFDWLLLSLFEFNDDNDLFKITKHKKGAIPPLADKITPKELDEIVREFESAQAEKTVNTLKATELENSFVEILHSPITQSEKEKRLSLVPAKVAASKVSSKMLDETLFQPIPIGELFPEAQGATEKDELPETVKQIINRINIMQRRKDSFDNILEESEKFSASEKGSAAHRILQFCDYNKITEQGLDAEISRLLEEKFISKRTAQAVNLSQLEGFFKSEFFKKAMGAKKVWREFKFGLFRPAADFTENDDLKSDLDGKKIFVQGSIDLILETDEGLILCDYKTDKISSAESVDISLLTKNMKEKHAAQLEAYRFAIKEIFGKYPDKVYIYSIPLGDVIEIL